MSDFDLSQVEYILMNGRGGHVGRYQDFYNQSFGFWRQFWNQVYKDNGTSEEVNCDDIFRTDIFAVLKYQNDILASHCYCMFDFQADVTMEQSYVKRSFPVETIEEFKKMGIRNVLSGEYLTVNPKYRRKVVGLPFAEIITSLGTQVLKAIHCDGAIAVVRDDVPVWKVPAKVGFKKIGDSRALHGTPCVICYIKTEDVVDLPDKSHAEVVLKLWDERRDLVGKTTNVLV